MDNPSYFIFPLLTCISFYYHSQGSNLSNNSDGQNVNTPSDDIELQQVHNHIQTALQENIGETSANDIDENVAKNEEESLASVSVEDEPNTESLDEEPTEPELRENEAVVVIETQEEPGPIQNVEEKRNDNEDVQFSVLQSNILYFLFALSFIMIIGADVAIQRARWLDATYKIYKSTTFKYLIVFIVNLYLWFDFIREARKVNIQSNYTSGNHQLMKN